MAAIVADTDYDYNNSLGERASDITQKIKSRRWLYLGLIGIGAIVVYNRFF